MHEDQQPCGAHALGEAIPGSYFDYTCDDCMLQYPHLDPEDDPNYSENDDWQTVYRCITVELTISVNELEGSHGVIY